MSDKVVVYDNSVFEDSRGKIYTIYPPENGGFKRLFCETKVAESKIRVLRGFHGDFVTGKLITCLSGVCNLVYFSIDEKSEDYLKVNSIILSGEHDNKAIFLPKGYVNAHYVPVVEGDNTGCLFFYQLTSPYNLQNQISIRWDSVGYDWGSINPILSERDKKSQTLQQYLESVNGKKN